MFSFLIKTGKVIKKYVVIPVLLLIALAGNLLIAYLIFRSPQVQTWMAQRVAAYISKELDTKVSVGGIDITWFMNIEIEDFKINDRRDSTILSTPSIAVKIDKINLKSRSINFRTININKAQVNLIKYKSDSVFNYNFIIDYFSGIPQAPTGNPWALSLKDINLKNSLFVYSDENKPYAIETGKDFIDFNHIKLVGLNLDARDISIKGEDIKTYIHNLSAVENSGFTIIQLKGNIETTSGQIKAENLKIKTKGSDLQTNLIFNYNSASAFNSFIDSVIIESKFGPSILDINELRYFTRDVDGMDNIINFNGIVRGRIAALKARDFHFNFGNNSSFEGDISLDGLPDIQETFIHLKVKKLTTDYYDLTNIKLPGNQKIGLPKELINVGIIDIRGFFTGFIYDFVSSASFYTSVGILETDLSLRTGKGKRLNYAGEFNLKEWDLGKTFNISDKVGLVSIKSSLNGEILNNKHNNVALNAMVEKAILLNNEFNDIKINGKLLNRQFVGNLLMNDELAQLDFNGMVDFSDSLPSMNFKAVLKDAYLARLNIWERDTTSRISTKMDLNFVGSNIDNILGYLRFDSTTYHESGKTYFVKNVELSTEAINHLTKKLSIRSDLFDASVYGLFSFGDFYHSITNIMRLYLPSLHLANGEKLEIRNNQLFDYNLQIKDARPLTELFLPEFTLDSEASIYGSYNSEDNNIVLNGMADRFTFKNITFEKWYIRGKNSGSAMQVISGVSNILLRKNEEINSAGLENLIFKAYMEGDSIKYSIDWNDAIKEDRNKGEIAGYFSFLNSPRIVSGIDKFNLVINNRLWTAKQEDAIIIDSTAIQIPGIGISSNDQRLRLSGNISKNPQDILALSFDRLDVSNVDVLLGVRNVDFDGILTGTVLVHDIYNTQKVEAKVEIKDFAFNKEKMGDAVIESIWNQEISALDINCDIIYHGNVSTHKPISARGLIYTSKRSEGNFDLDVQVFNYKLASLNPFLRGIASNVNGFASGALKLRGTFRDPEITGQLELMRAQMKIDYLNVTYSFADKVIAEADQIMAKNITIYDSLGNTGTLDFSLKHKNFRDIRMNIDIGVNKMNSLNTTYKNNNLFYGKAFGTGNVNISGSFKNVNIRVDAKSEPNTFIYIPINLAVDAKENNFIRFKTKTDDKTSAQDIYVPKETGTEVGLNLVVTRDANMQLFLPENIGNIKGTGNGNIQLGVNKQGEMSIYGDYVMEEGSFLFTLGNVINRVFDIQEGSTISFTGSPYEADIDLSAIYRLKASLKGLSEEYTGSSIPVDCIIKLKNNLYNPDISFSINLPETNNDLNQLVFAEFDTTNQVIMTQQIVSLLVLKTFTFNRTPDITTSVSSSSIEVLTDQLSNMLSQIIKDVDIGVKYRTGNSTLTDEEVEVALSTNLFNDRVSIDGNVGMYTQGTTENASNIVGDVVIDVKITPDGRFRVKAFNRSNPFEMSAIPMSPYKQGIGVYYRYEFDKFSEIFHRKKKKAELVPEQLP